MAVELNALVSHYRILKKLGEGGMGEVYLAEDTNLGRKVALKFLPSEYALRPDFKARFEREARAAAALNHPNAIIIYEVGEDQNRAYIAMEYVDGESLEQLIAREQLPLNQAIDIILQICAGLSAAHQAGITHRDLKPANVLIDKTGKVKVADFGLAKLEGSPQLTKSGTIMGTLYYMSPEQVRGEKLDSRSDIFSLGVMLYELLTAKLPFGGNNVPAISHAIAYEDPKPAAELNPEIPEALEQVINKALQKRPENRYASMSALLNDLKMILPSFQPTIMEMQTPIAPTIDKIGSRYRLLKELGKGGMGEVYLAQDTLLDREVVLKFMLPQYLANPELKARFLREARVAARLKHPNLITIHDFGEDQNRAYIAMEYVDGESLKDLLARKELSMKEALALILQICDGLNAAHQAGITHRDLKPANILLDKKGQVKVADFGLARLEGSTPLTQAGSIMGTVRYMSPEQVRGKELDSRSDIFSLGVMLYELLSRQLPFSGDNDFAIFEAIKQQKPEPLSRYQPDVPKDLQKILDKVLAKDREKRYQLVEELASDLKGVLPPPIPMPDPKPNKKTAAIVIASAVILVAGLLGLWLLANQSPAPTKTMLSITTTPDGATVLLNDDSVGVTPLQLAEELPEKIALHLQKPDYFDFDTTILLTKSRDEEFSFILKRKETAKKPPVVQEPKDPGTGTKTPALFNDMALIPAGSFLMGSADGDDDEKPERQVVLEAFYMDKYEVTVARYQRFLEATGQQAPDYWTEQLQRPDYPVVFVSWGDAVAYAKWAGKRLPTEAEWEYAARGGNTGIGGKPNYKYPWGNEASASKANFDFKQNRWYSWEEARNSLKPVGSYTANGYELFNMVGNVSEWCSSLYQTYPYNRDDGRENPTASGTRVLRGGSWNNYADYIRCAKRYGIDPTEENFYAGFRCARDAR